MNLILSRTQTNQLYTMGELSTNQEAPVHTVEATRGLLPAGNYHLKLVKTSEHKQLLSILRLNVPAGTATPTGQRLVAGDSWLSSRNKNGIVIGEYLIPGVVFKSRKVYRRLVDRIAKAVERGEAVELRIIDSGCRSVRPERHWLTVLALLSALVLSAAGCSSLRPASAPVVVEHTHHDTVYLHQQQYDSVSVFHSHEQDSRPDTVFVRDTFTEYRYRLLRDTLRIVDRDTVPVIRQVEVVREVHRLPSWAKTLSGIGAASLLLCLFIFISKLQKL